MKTQLEPLAACAARGLNFVKILRETDDRAAGIAPRRLFLGWFKRPFLTSAHRMGDAHVDPHIAGVLHQIEIHRRLLRIAVEIGRQEASAV